MKFVRQFEEFNSAKEILTEDDLYLILADFIEEDGYDIVMQKWYSKNIFDIAIKIGVNAVLKFLNKEKDEGVYNDIIEKLIDKGFYVVADSGEIEHMVFFGPEFNYLKISITNEEEEVKNILASVPSSFELKNT